MEKLPGGIEGEKICLFRCKLHGYMEIAGDRRVCPVWERHDECFLPLEGPFVGFVDPGPGSWEKS